jgi:hypothetical protein
MFIVNYLIKMNAQFHKCNLANNTEGAKLTLSIRNFNLQRSQVRNRVNTGLNQSLIYICLFPPLSPQYFKFASLQLRSKKNCNNNIEGLGLFAPPPLAHPKLCLCLIGLQTELTNTYSQQNPPLRTAKISIQSKISSSGSHSNLILYMDNTGTSLYHGGCYKYYIWTTQGSIHRPEYNKSWQRTAG